MSGAHGMRFGAELRLPLEIVDKKKGETKGGYVCRHWRGFWEGVEPLPHAHQGAQAQVRAAPAHPGEPPQHLYEAWVKDRIEFSPPFLSLSLR